MPHQCTECGRTFPDGSKEMLSGCPDCGGNKFQFDPKGRDTDGGQSAAADTDRRTEATDRRADTAEPADATGRAWPTHGDETGAATGEQTADSAGLDGSDADDGIIEADETPMEDSAQAAARSGFAGPFEVDSDGDDAGAENADDTAGDAPGPGGSASDTLDDGPPDEGPPVDESERTAAGDPDASAEDQPDLAELREELNEQFESIRIKSPGHYELNLMELYDREEYIISLKEDGRYVIEVPETWRNGPNEG